MYSILSLYGVTTSILFVSNAAHAHKPPHGGASSYVAPAGFPTSVFSSYWRKPVATQEPQPVIYDPVLNITFPLNLTDQTNIPQEDVDPIYFPVPIRNLSDSEQEQVINNVTTQIGEIISGNTYTTNCTKCKAALTAGKTAAQLAPARVPDMLVDLCKSYKFHSNTTCEEDFEATTFGAIWTQVLAFADTSGLDGTYICGELSSTFCSFPNTSALDTTKLFPKPKPANATAPKASGKRVKVLHMSDIHLDPRYSAGSEANCSSGLCCRTNVDNSALPAGQVSLASPLFGSFLCDSPYDLTLAALESVGPLSGTGKESGSFAWTLYTGDLVSHDSQNQLSRAYTEYAEVSVYQMMKHYINGPIFPALGNHDGNPEAIDAPHSLPGRLGQQQSWNFDHVSALWKHEGWIDDAAVAEARTHYGAYSIKNHYGLRIITFNGDFWYRSNFLNYINTTNPDVSTTFQFVIDELQAAEDCGERVWLVAHVLSGWDGTNPMPNPTNLFYQIIDRYSPHVIANVFFGHTHEDQVMIYYANNGTERTGEAALTPGWIGPSVTPLTNLNSGYRVYEVDTGDFNIYEAYTFYANVSAFPQLNNTGPTFELEYSTRDTYGAAANWPTTAPLNATFWHSVTEAMANNHSLVSTFNTYQGKSSVKSPNCTCEACIDAKICYIRSGSVALAQTCPKGFGSVQSAFTGKC